MLESPKRNCASVGPTLRRHPRRIRPDAGAAQSRTPQLWILGADDTDAPSAETAKRLTMLASNGAPITTAIFPGAEHGIYEYETAADGTRLSTRQPDGYFTMMCDFIRDGRVHPEYGRVRPSGPAAR